MCLVEHIECDFFDFYMNLSSLPAAGEIFEILDQQFPFFSRTLLSRELGRAERTEFFAVDFCVNLGCLHTAGENIKFFGCFWTNNRPFFTVMQNYKLI